MINSSKIKSIKNTTLRPPTAACLGVLLAYAPLAHSASQIWDGGSAADGNWGRSDNWNGAVPGSTAAVSGDIATFNAAIVNTWGNSAGNPVVIDSASQYIGGLAFTTASGNYFVR